MRGKRSFLCGRNIHARTYVCIGRCSFDDEAARAVVAAYPGRPQAEHRRVPGTPDECAAPSPLCIRRGTSRQASLTEKTHSFSQQRSRKQKAVAARRGAVHRGPLVKILFTSVAMAARSRAALSHTHPVPSNTFLVLPDIMHGATKLLIRRDLRMSGDL